jgi:hypothetical protein
MVSLPIPEDGSRLRYCDISLGSIIPDFGRFVTQLPGHNVKRDAGVHLDPDLRRELHRSIRKWRPLFGQCNAAAGHLSRQGVAEGDLFLFFGWFREIDEEKRYRREADDQHVLWGWLQVERSFDPKSEVPHWARHHPHCVESNRKNDRVYVGRQHLTFSPQKPGAGIFEKHRDELRLTHPEQARQRSSWRLPAFFRDRLSYQSERNWAPTSDPQTVSLASAKIGQEFVFLTGGHEAAVGKWLGTLFTQVPKGASY